MIKTKKQMFIVLGAFILVMLLGTVTYAFFNYTRTGTINNLGTGRIYFNSEQNGSLNMTNIFPLTSTQAGNANLDTVTVGIVGDTTYADGEEFEISLVDVTNTINGKKIPINYIATYEATTGNTIGAESETYWESREAKNANIYTLNETGIVREGTQVLVGYIKSDNTGINGILTIKAYIDADRIAITDTYDPNPILYSLNSNMSQEELNNCVSYLSSLDYANILETGETLNDFCLGTGTLGGMTFQEVLNNAFVTGDMEYFLEHNIVLQKNYTDDTTSEWVRGRSVFTTNEWNSFQNGGAGISFKIRAESNEGIWVEEPAQGTIESCPGCKFMYLANTPMYTTWNTYSQTPTILTSVLYENYQELIGTTNKNYFIGVKLNNNNEVTNAYACGVKDNVPFCLEGTLYGAQETATAYATNKGLLQGTNLYNNTCTEYLDANTGNGYDYVECGPWDNSGSLSAGADSDGSVYAGVGISDRCYVYSDGIFACGESDSGGGGESPK